MAIGEIAILIGASILIAIHYLVENTPRYQWNDSFEPYTEIMPIVGWGLVVVGIVELVVVF